MMFREKLELWIGKFVDYEGTKYLLREVGDDYLLLGSSQPGGAEVLIAFASVRHVLHASRGITLAIRGGAHPPS